LYTRRVLRKALVIGTLVLPAVTLAMPPGLSRPGAAAAREPHQALELIKPGRLQAAKAFQAGTPDGKSMMTLEDFKGKVVFLNFWATWCAPCKEELPSMERLYQKYKDRGLVVLALSVDPEPSAVIPFVRDRRLSFHVGIDPKLAVANLYGVRALPSSFIIDRRGNLSSVALGAREWDGKAANAFFDSILR
jgi:peroxiredoxin